VFFFGVLTFLIINRETALIRNIYMEHSSTEASLVSEQLKYLMFKGESAEVMQYIATVNKDRHLKVSIADREGRPAFGTQADPALRELLTQNRTSFIRGHDLIFYKPLHNEKRCHSCHNALDKSRGAIITRHSMEAVETEIRETAWRILLLAVFLGFASEIFLLLVLRKSIMKPLAILSHGAEIIKKGRLDHRINVKSDDEVGALASCFNEMAESVEKSHTHLESAVKQKTKEMRVIAELSTQVFTGDLSFPAIAGQFLSAIKDQMGFDFTALCLVDKETGLLSPEVNRGVEAALCVGDISLAGDHPFAQSIREARPTVRRSADIGIFNKTSKIALIPILSHQRKRCRDINLCTFEECPAFWNPDERCWLIKNTFCRSPQAVAGREKIYGCLHCLSFPVLGVLIAGKNDEIKKSSLHSLEILSSELASAIENQKFIETKKDDIDKLINLHDMSVESLQGLRDALSHSIVSSVAPFSNSDAAVLWLKGEDETLYAEDSFHIEKKSIPGSLQIKASFAGKSIAEDRIVETLEMGDVAGLDDIVRSHGFLYAATVPLKYKDSTFGCLTLFKKRDFLMTGSQRAIVLLFATQAAAAIHTARIYQALRESEERYRSFVESATDIIFMLSMEGHITTLSPSFESVTGWSRAGWLGRHLTRIVHPDDIPLAEEMLRLALQGERPSTFELRIDSRAGDYLTGEFTITPHIRNGQQAGIFGIARDRTERKRTDENLRKLMLQLSTQKEFSDAIFNHTASGIVVLDKEGRLIRINKAGTEILASAAEDLAGMKVSEISPSLSQWLVLEHNLDREVVLLTGDGTSRPIGFSTSPLLDIESNEMGTIVVFRDLTEIKKLQREIREKENFETVGKVISGVAHEVRNPLFGISSIGQILEKELNSPQHKLLIQAMLKETGRMRRLIDELLLYTRPARLDIKEVNIKKLLEEMQHYARAKNENIVLASDVPALLSVRCDRDKITQVFLNLINNAIDAAKAQISISAVKTPGGAVEIRVADDGAGIRKEDIGKIFDPFFTTKKGGTGLGLPICKKIIEDHGGAIDIQDSPGAGTTVRLTFKE